MSIFLAKKMHYFMTVMEELNISKAAEKLCITRSPLTKSICEIENSLGGKLFQRGGGALEPTELAHEYYLKCRHLYDELLSLERDMHHRTTIQPLNVIFDFSVPELYYRLITSAMATENLQIEHRREMINMQDLNVLQERKNYVVVSLRDLSGRFCSDVDKWKTDNLVLMSPEGWLGSHIQNHIFIWKDLHLNYMKRVYTEILKKDYGEFEFIYHNNDLATLFYNVHAGIACALTTRKVASMFKIDKVKYHNIDNYTLNIFVYHRNEKKLMGKVSQIKEIVNRFL